LKHGKILECNKHDKPKVQEALKIKNLPNQSEKKNPKVVVAELPSSTSNIKIEDVNIDSSDTKAHGVDHIPSVKIGGNNVLQEFPSYQEKKVIIRTKHLIQMQLTLS